MKFWQLFLGLMATCCVVATGLWLIESALGVPHVVRLVVNSIVGLAIGMVWPSPNSAA